MQKIACIFSFQESNWVSCQKIVFNLHKAYQACPNLELKNFNLSHVETTDLAETTKTARDIYDYGADVISFMDHKPHPATLIQVLNGLYLTQKKPKLIFHLFGDFTLFYPNWSLLAPKLEGYEVEFIVASDRQKILVDNMLTRNKALVCPFPVDPKEFYFDESQREKQRKEWGFTNKDVVYLFTGRLSRQKRIKTLIKCFSSEFEKQPHAHLFIYGSPDNIGDPFLGVLDLEGEYFRTFYKVYRELAPEIQGRIHFMGSVPNSDLLKVYQGADVLMNLSVHNDEDYGMSVAEAQHTGLVCALTDWGGLASFAHPDLPQAVQFIPVKFGERTKLVSQIGTKKVLNAFFQNPQPVKRELIVSAAIKKFGMKRAASIIEMAITRKSETFAGFSDLFNRARAAQIASPTDPMFIGSKFTINQLYKDIYSAYVRHN